MTGKPNKYPAQMLFFPAAICHALIIVPLTVLTNLGLVQRWPALLGSGHAHEMLAGFALALVAGYMLGNQPLPKLLLLFGLWLLGRAVLLPLPPALPVIAMLAFGVLLVAQVLPRFFPARRWRNRALLPLLAAISLLPGTWSLLGQMGRATHAVNGSAETAGILFLTLLMLFIGGRLIAPAAAGSFYQQGSRLDARVQPPIEGALIILLPVAISLFVLGWRHLAGLALLLSAVLALVRLWRWRLWACAGRTDLYGLGIGYAWLAVGLAMAGGGLLLGRFHPALLHVITIGALGTLSTGVMARWYFHQNDRSLPSHRFVLWSVTAIAIAALARIAALWLPRWHAGFLWAAVVAWEAAYLALLVHVIRYVLPGTRAVHA